MSQSAALQGMRISMLITGLGPGGAETQLVRLAKGLKSRGWQVQVISLLAPEAFGDELTAANIPVLSLGLQRGSFAPWALARTIKRLREWRPRVLVTFMFHANLLGRVAGRLAHVPVIVSSIRSERFGGYHRDILERLTEWLADTTIANSQYVAECLIERGIVARGRLRVIPNAVDLETFRQLSSRERCRKTLGFSEQDFIWLAVGRLEEPKDYPGLLRAFQRLIQQEPSARLKVAGRGPLLEPLQQLTQDLAIADRVEFLGFRSDVAALLKAADALVMASAWEGLPNVVMEALAAGCPVVATHVGGIPELVTDGVNGFLVPPQDSETLARAMSRMMRLSPEDRCRMGLTGQTLISEKYDLDRVLGEWENLFFELLGSKGSK